MAICLVATIAQSKLDGNTLREKDPPQSGGPLVARCQLAGNKRIEVLNKVSLWCYRHRRVVVALWIVALAALGLLSQRTGAEYSEDFRLPNTESKEAVDLLMAQAAGAGATAETENVVIRARQGTVDDPGVRRQVELLRAQLADLDHVVRVGDVYAGEGRVSADRTIAVFPLVLDGAGDTLGRDTVVEFIAAARELATDAVQVELAGPTVQYASEQPEESNSELIGLVAAAIVLFFAFGSVFTMFLPILTALLALGIGLSLIGFLTHVFTIATFGPTLAALLGLGVGIDYALFIVSRHRVNLLRGMPVEQSVVTAMNTSGRAVLFAGITVCIGIAGLLLLGIAFLYGLAVSTVIAVLMTMLASLTFLPAMLGFVGMKALSKTQRHSLANGQGIGAEEMSPAWLGFARAIQRRPAPLATAAFAAMAILAIPFFDMRLGNTDAGGDPRGTTTREAYELLATGFGPGYNGPLVLVAKLEKAQDSAAFQELLASIATEENVATVTPASTLPGGNVAVAQVIPQSSPQAEETNQLIDDLRHDVTHPFTDRTGTEVYIGGFTAIYHDFTQVLAGKMPLFVGVVVALSFLLLMAVFRSLLIPLVASLMNLLAAAASFGVVVAIFQWGWGAELFGIDRTGPITPFLPVIAFAILFGLSMDYEVFLVSRMYEEWHRRGHNNDAIALGQAETGRVITAAASIMVVIFASFVFGGDPKIKLFGIALATAVLLDAVLIRTILVPALMQMLGNANWYLPRWLDRILPTVNVEPRELGSHP